MKRVVEQLKKTRIGQLFLDKKFFHYTWIGIFISVINVLLLWLLIDVAHLSTVLSSTIVVALTFVIRYVMFRRFGAL